MRPATQVEADAFSAHMASHFRACIVRKSSVPERQWISAALDIARLAGANVPSGVEFFEQYATTIGPMILMPDGMSPDAQIEVMTHECQHVQQFWERGGQVDLASGLGYCWLYLVQPEARVRFEVEGYRAQLEVVYARNKRLPEIDSLVMPLEGGYALGQGDLMLARSLFEIAGTSIVNGIVSTNAGTVAIEYMKRSIPELLA